MASGKMAPAGYSPAQILLHWAIMLLVAFQLIFGEAMEEALDAFTEGEPIGADDAVLADLHLYAGIAILVLVLVRIVLRLKRGAPPPPADSARWETVLAASVHGAFYALLAVVPVTGLLAWYVNPEIGDLHAFSKPAFIVLILLHVAGVAYHAFLKGDDVVMRMITPKG